MSKKHLVAAACIVIFLGVLTSCSQKSMQLDPTKPLTITLWHNYGSQMQSQMDELIDEFNLTVGREEGVIISVTAVSAMKDQEEQLAMIADGVPGAGRIPDIVTVYPRTAARLAEEGLIVSLDDLFSNEELAAYVPQFVEEGRLSDGKLYVFPIAKSTEMLFVNQTLFDRFSAATGASVEKLSTFEGIAETANLYYDWTDSLTPKIENDGKTFFMADSWGNISLVGMTQMGEPFVTPEGLKTDKPQYERIWQALIPQALSGSYAVIDGYSSELSLTGDIVCSTGSTAGVTFYGDTITYPDNSSEKVEYNILPYPVFRNAEKVALQRGAGMVIAKSEPAKEYAAALFLKWLSATEQNLRFISSTGYLPVTIEAYENISSLIQTEENPNIHKMYETAQLMKAEYTFITAPNFDGYDDLFKEYEEDLKTAMLEGRQRVQSGDTVQHISLTLFDDFSD